MIKITNKEQSFYQELIAVAQKKTFKNRTAFFQTMCCKNPLITWAIDFVTSLSISESFKVVSIQLSLQNCFTFIADNPGISGYLSLITLLISWWVFLFVRTNDFLSSSDVTIDKAILCLVRKYFLKAQIRNAIKNNLCIFDAMHSLIFISQLSFI